MGKRGEEDIENLRRRTAEEEGEDEEILKGQEGKPNNDRPTRVPTEAVTKEDEKEC